SLLVVRPRPPSSTLFPYTPLFRSGVAAQGDEVGHERGRDAVSAADLLRGHLLRAARAGAHVEHGHPVRGALVHVAVAGEHERAADRKSTRLNSSHVKISYAVFCLK